MATTSNPASARSRATASRHIGWSSTTITLTGSCARASRRRRLIVRRRCSAFPPCDRSRSARPSEPSARPPCPGPAPRSSSACRRGRAAAPGSTGRRRAAPRPRPAASRPSGMPGPSSRTVTITASGSSSTRIQARAPSPACLRTLSRAAPTAAASSRGRRRPAAPGRPARRR